MSDSHGDVYVDPRYEFNAPQWCDFSTQDSEDAYCDEWFEFRSEEDDQRAFMKLKLLSNPTSLDSFKKPTNHLVGTTPVDAPSTPKNNVLLTPLRSRAKRRTKITTTPPEEKKILDTTKKNIITPPSRVVESAKPTTQRNEKPKPQFSPSTSHPAPKPIKRMSVNQTNLDATRPSRSTQPLNAADRQRSKRPYSMQVQPSPSMRQKPTIREAAGARHARVRSSFQAFLNRNTVKPVRTTTTERPKRKQQPQAKTKARPSLRSSIATTRPPAPKPHITSAKPPRPVKPSVPATRPTARRPPVRTSKAQSARVSSAPLPNRSERTKPLSKPKPVKTFPNRARNFSMTALRDSTARTSITPTNMTSQTRRNPATKSRTAVRASSSRRQVPGYLRMNASALYRKRATKAAPSHARRTQARSKPQASGSPMKSFRHRKPLAAVTNTTLNRTQVKEYKPKPRLTTPVTPDFIKREMQRNKLKLANDAKSSKMEAIKQKTNLHRMRMHRKRVLQNSGLKVATS